MVATVTESRLPDSGATEAWRRIPRTDRLLEDPRLAAAEERLGRALVKAAIARAQDRARDGAIAPEEVANAAVAELRRVPCR